MNEQVKWCFYDPETKTKTADLVTEEAQMTILKMRPKDINRFYYSRSGENSWKPLKMLMSSSSSPFAGLTMLTAMTDQADKSTVNSNLKMQAVDKDAQDEIERTFTNSCIDAQKTIAVHFNKPAAKTIDLVLMNSRGMIFKASAVNPTPQGCQSDKEIPSHFLNTTIDIVVVNSAATNKYFEKIMISGKVVTKPQGQYLEFTFASEAQRSQLIESLNFCENHSHRKTAV